MGFVCGEDRQQSSLFPLSLDERVPADHVCRVIEAFVARLPLLQLGFAKAAPKATGRPPYDPGDLLKLYLYGYLHQLRSSRRLERECQRNVEAMWLLNRLAPDHKTIAQFRRDHSDAIKRAGAWFVRFCQGAGVVRGEWVAIDGSKFQAVASAKAVLHRKALLEEQARIEARIAAYLVELEAGDAATADEPLTDPQAVALALEALRERKTLMEELTEAVCADGHTHLVVSEPDARRMKGHGPGYNVQSAVDGAHGLIVAHDVHAEASDNRSLQPMAEAARDVLGVNRLDVLADAGYSNGAQAAALEAQNILPHVPAHRGVNNQGDGTQFDRTAFAYDPDNDRFTCPAGRLLDRKQLDRKEQRVIYAANPRHCDGCALKPACTQSRQRHVTRHVHEEALQRMHARATPEAMRKRRSTVEHPFAALKYLIFEKPRFLLRGLRGARTEMAIATLVWNMKRAMRVLGEACLIRQLAPS